MKWLVRGDQRIGFTVEVEAETEREAKQIAWEGRYTNRKVVHEGEELFDEARPLESGGRS